jgi:YesN/AraC family two-component response regulator
MKFNIKKHSILIVEDEEQILRQMSFALEDFFDNVFTANNGKAALNILQNNKIDVLITDLLMPIMDGIELIKKVKEDKIDIGAIIITSAHSEHTYLLDAIKLKVDGYLLKPIIATELLELIKKSLELKKREEELWQKDRLLDGIGAFVGGKKIEIIKYLFENANENSVFNGSYEDIMADLNVSKPTVVATFKQLIEVGLVTKLKNKQYQVNFTNPL